LHGFEVPKELAPMGALDEVERTTMTQLIRFEVGYSGDVLNPAESEQIQSLVSSRVLYPSQANSGH
jgi:hypothetical protein